MATMKMMVKKMMMKMMVKKMMMVMLVKVMMIVCWTILFAGSSGLVAECRPALARFSQFTHPTTTAHFYGEDIFSTTTSI